MKILKRIVIVAHPNITSCILTWIGDKFVEDPYIILDQISTIYYYFLFIINILVSKLDDILMFKVK